MDDCEAAKIGGSKSRAAVTYHVTERRCSLIDGFHCLIHPSSPIRREQAETGAPCSFAESEERACPDAWQSSHSSPEVFLDEPRRSRVNWERIGKELGPNGPFFSKSGIPTGSWIWCTSIVPLTRSKRVCTPGPLVPRTCRVHAI